MGNPTQQLYVVYNPLLAAVRGLQLQPAAVRGLQPLLAAVCGLEPQSTAVCGLQPLVEAVFGLQPQPAAVRGLQPLLAGRGGDPGGGGHREEGLRKTRSIPWLEYSSPRSCTASRHQPGHVASRPRANIYCTFLVK